MRKLKVIGTVVGVGLLVVGVGCVAWRAQFTVTGDVLSVEGSRDSRTLVVTHASCGQEGRVTIKETSSDVEIGVTLDHPVRGMCDAPVSVTTVELDSVLGERDVTGRSRVGVLSVVGRDR